MPRKQISPDQMTFNFTAEAQRLALEGGDQHTLSPFERRLRQVLKAVFDDAARRGADPIDRAEIARRMTEKLGREISKSHLDQWTAMATVDRRMHVDALKAVCEVTGDLRPMHAFAEASGLKLLTAEEAVCAEYGAKLLFKKLLTEDIKDTLQGVDEQSLKAQLVARFEGGIK
ncbi:MAG: hypothetical protein GC185_01720 [Alphaproteobacteria bacterium]|nr:hypothetical protein [Alphaproteobacteria bacterium]